MKVENSEKIRKNVRSLLGEKFDIENSSICKNIEVSIFNYTIKEATRKKIVKKWENKYFVQLYVNRLRTLMSNMSSNNSLLMSIKNKKLEKLLIFLVFLFPFIKNYLFLDFRFPSWFVSSRP